MEEKRIKQIQLDNRLTLELFDASRKVAGDRWRVTLVTRIEIPVDAVSGDPDEALPPTETLRSALGDPVLFEQIKHRNFIADSEKEAVFEDLCRNFNDTALSYLGHPAFPRRYVLKKFAEYCRRQGWSGGTRPQVFPGRAPA